MNWENYLSSKETIGGQVLNHDFSIKKKNYYTDKLVALGAHLLPPLPPSMLRFTGIQSYSYMEQRKVETDVDRMTGIELWTLQLRRPRTNRLSYVCFWEYYMYVKTTPPLSGMTWKSTMWKWHITRITQSLVNLSLWAGWLVWVIPHDYYIGLC